MSISVRSGPKQRRDRCHVGDGTRPARVSGQCAFFLAEQGSPGVVVEHGPTDAMFNAPQDPRTSDYVQGRFG